jgi:hypothetical protein
MTFQQFQTQNGMKLLDSNDISLTQDKLGWMSIYGPVYNTGDNINFSGVAADYVGHSYSVGVDHNLNWAVVVKYNKIGDVIWKKAFTNVSYSNLSAQTVLLAPNGSLHVLGTLYTGTNTAVYILLLDSVTGLYLGSRIVSSDTSDLTVFDAAWWNNDVAFVGGSIPEYEDFPVVSQAGSEPGILYVEASVFAPQTPTTQWVVSGTGITGTVTILNVDTSVAPLIKLTVNNLVDFGGAGSWTVKRPLNSQGYIYTTDWQQYFSGGQTDAYDALTCIRVNTDNHLVVAGQSVGGVNSGPLMGIQAAVVSKFDTEGSLVWSYAINDAAQPGIITSLDVDSQNNIVLGHFAESSNTVCVTLMDSNGTIIWQKATSGASAAFVPSVIFDETHIYFVAITTTNEEYQDAFMVIKLDMLGNIEWQRLLSTLSNELLDMSGSRRLASSALNIHFVGSTLYAANFAETAVSLSVPKTGADTGGWGWWYYYETIYAFDSFEGLRETYIPVITNSAFADNANIGMIPNTSDTEVHTKWIYDDAGGAVAFADGSRQMTSATDIPQTLLFGGSYRIILRDRHKHLYITEPVSTYIIVPRNVEIPFPRGSVVLVVNNSGQSVTIQTSHPEIDLISPDLGINPQYMLANRGYLQLLKTEENVWFATGWGLSTS